MLKLNETLQNIINSTDGLLGVSVIEIDSRKLIGFSQGKADLSPATLEAIAVFAIEMLRGKSISAIESLLSENSEKPIASTINELYFNTKHARFLFSVIHDKPGILIVLSTDVSVTVGMGWLLIRKNMEKISESLP